MSKKFNRNEYDRRRYKEVFKPAYKDFIALYDFGTDDLDGEIWIPVPDFETIYHVSNYGRAKSFQLGKVTILTPKLHTGGYLCIALYKNGKAKYFYLHILVATLFIPNSLNLPEVNHIDGNKFNNHVSNLEWATSSDNQKHAHATGLALSGIDRPDSAIKDEATIIYIRNNPDGLTQEELAQMFDTTVWTIRRIQLGKTYQNVGGQIRESQRRLTSEEKAEIRRLYVKGSREFGARALAKLFNCGKTQILRIVKTQ